MDGMMGGFQKKPSCNDVFHPMIENPTRPTCSWLCEGSVEIRTIKNMIQVSVT